MTTTASDVWVGIDLGTQSVRAIAATSSGEVRSVGRAALTSDRRGERHEQDPRAWWDAVGKACREMTSGLNTANRVRALAVCGTSGTVLLVDTNGEPLTTAIMYDDGRAAEEAERANTLGPSLWTRLGYGNTQKVWGLPKWMWRA